jgi:flagellar basal-body rod protein FlgC
MELNISPVDIAVSGLRAQSTRMQVISNNIANAQTTDVNGTGKPYRRKDVGLTTSEETLTGVDIEGVQADMKTDFKKVLSVGHPHADANGYVTMPNVSVPEEMMHMVVATRAYQASAAVLKRYQDMTDTTLELLR